MIRLIYWIVMIASIMGYRAIRMNHSYLNEEGKSVRSSEKNIHAAIKDRLGLCTAIRLIFCDDHVWAIGAHIIAIRQNQTNHS